MEHPITKHWYSTILLPDEFEEALAVAELAIAQPVGEQTLLHYYKSWCLIRLGKTAEAQIAIATAEKEPADYCFPNALEAIEALQCVVDFAGKAPKHFIPGKSMV